MNLKIIRLPGLVAIVLGFVLAFGAATFDLFTGDNQVGDSQIGAFFISIAILLLGFLLLQLSSNMQLKERVESLQKLQANIKGEPTDMISKLFNPLGVITTLIGLPMMSILTLKDYEPLLIFNIGPLQMLAIFGGIALALVGLGFMSMGNSVLSNTMKPLILQIEALMKRGAEAPTETTAVPAMDLNSTRSKKP